MRSNLQKLLTLNPGFWFYQITGWLLFLIYIIIIQYHFNPDQHNLLPIFLISIFYAFLITILLRELYKYLFKRKYNFFIHVISAFGSVIIASFFWIVIRDFSSNLLFKSDPYTTFFAKDSSLSKLMFTTMKVAYFL